MPFVIIMGLDAVIYTLNMASNGLYVVDEVATVSIPLCAAVKNHEIEAMVSGFEIIKNLATKLRSLDETLEEIKKSKKRKTIKRLTPCLETPQEKNDTPEKWTRPVWFPPIYENDSDNDE